MCGNVEQDETYTHPYFINCVKYHLCKFVLYKWHVKRLKKYNNTNLYVVYVSLNGVSVTVYNKVHFISKYIFNIKHYNLITRKNVLLLKTNLKCSLTLQKANYSDKCLSDT